jgi:two-component system response regulator YesN
LKTLDWDKSFGKKEKELMRYAFRNVAQELLIADDKSGEVITVSDGTELALRRQDSPASADPLLLGACDELINIGRKQLGHEVNCLIGEAAAPENLAASVEALIQYEKRNVASQGSTYFMDGSSPEQSGWTTPVHLTDDLRRLLDADDTDGLARAMDVCLGEMSSAGLLNDYTIRIIQQDFLQALYQYLQKNNIQANLIYQDKRSFMLFEKSQHSLIHFREWMTWTLDKTMEVVRSVRLSDSLVAKIKKHIAAHIGEDIGREDIAKAFYLNPDYLSRLFRQATGMTLTDYVVNKRMDLARQLLTQTDISIGDIALQLGYSSFSYFSKLFREATGSPPSAYRKGRAAK